MIKCGALLNSGLICENEAIQFFEVRVDDDFDSYEAKCFQHSHLPLVTGTITSSDISRDIYIIGSIMES